MAQLRQQPGPVASRISITAIAIAIMLAVTISQAQAQTFTVLHSFTGGADGANPIAGLTVAGTESFYSTTSEGGNPDAGVVYHSAHAGSGWIVAPLFAFPGGYYGQHPLARAIIGPNGTLFGFAQGGYYSLGLVFNLTPHASICTAVLCGWSNSVLYRFMGGTDGGGAPEYGDLIFDQEGDIYGTTAGAAGIALGTVYKLTPTNGGWTNNVLFGFSPSNNANGVMPEGGVIFDRVGNLYGTTLTGGTDNVGLVFQLTPSGSGRAETILHNFQGASAGGFPTGGLIFDQAGNLYGTTNGNGGPGTVFELSPSQGEWTFNTLHVFTGTELDGPYAGVTMDAAGNLYGDTLGGAYGYGEVFKLTPGQNGSWTYTDLYDFFGAADGSMPYGKVVIDNSGNLFGTAQQGGAYGRGVIWQIAQ